MLARVGGGLPAAFWRLWTASTFANLADGVFWVAIPLLAITLTTEPALVAGVTVASRLPWLVFALVAGALADRLDRRRTMIVVDLARVVLIAGLAIAVLADVATIWLLYIVAFVLGVLETMFDTAAISMLPAVVSRDRLNGANARLNATEQAMNQFVGPPVGGLLAAAGLAVAFGLAAASYVGAALLILSLAGSFRPERSTPPGRIDREIREGLVYLFRHSLLRTLAIVIALINLCQGAAWAILVLYLVAPGPVGLDEVGYGLLLTANAAGSVIGTLLAGPIERFVGRPNLLLVGIVALAVYNLTLVATTNPLVIGVVMAVNGAFIGAFNVAYQSLRQRLVPDRILGRVVASFRMLGWGALPIGALLGGAFAQAFGLTAVFLGAAVLTLLLVPTRLLVTEERITRAEAEALAAGNA